MQVITEIELLQRIDAFLERHEMAPTTFGRLANNEQQLIDSIRKGRSPSLKVTHRVVAFMERKDAEAKLNPPPLELTPPPADEVELDLPFRPAPATGASSPISSPTSGHPQPSAASGSCPSCSDPERDAA